MQENKEFALRFEQAHSKCIACSSKAKKIYTQITDKEVDDPYVASWPGFYLQSGKVLNEEGRSLLDAVETIEENLFKSITGLYKASIDEIRSHFVKTLKEIELANEEEKWNLTGEIHSVTQIKKEDREISNIVNELLRKDAKSIGSRVEDWENHFLLYNNAITFYKNYMTTFNKLLSGYTKSSGDKERLSWTRIGGTVTILTLIGGAVTAIYNYVSNMMFT